MRPGPILAALAVTLLTAGCGAIPGWQREPDQVVIGVDLNLTGRGNEFGAVFDDALRLQLERLNRRDQAGERTSLRLEVRDNRGDPEVAATNLTELLADSRISGIIAGGCPACVVDLAPRLTTPVISLDPETAVAAPAAERRWVFRIGPDAAANADALVAEMAQAGVRTVGVIAVDSRYGDEGLAAVSAAAGESGLTIAQRQRVSTDREQAVAAAAQQVAGWQPAPDPLTQLATPDGSPARGPDAVVVWVPAPQAAEVTHALRANEYAGTTYLDMLAADQLYLEQDPGDATLVFTPTLVVDTRFATSPALSQRRQWFDDYRSRYGAYHAHSSFAADALLVLADAVRRAEHLDRATLRDQIESTRLDGLTGQIRFTADQHSGLHPSSLTILSASNGRWR